jgi:GGDEF domain-containing protein
VGDETIKSLAQAFKKSLKESALSKKTVLARKGGDEFILTLVKDENRNMEEFKADLLEFFYNVNSNLKKYIKENPFTPEDQFLEDTSYSIGLVKYPKTEKEKIEQEKQVVSIQELVNLANEILKINKKSENNNQIPMTIASEIFKLLKIDQSSS